ncbi:O-Glycosyl hydrolases family 17 protein [Hibiscus syriacus]|uniref:O-Glycosyl hydrolases family 17 protein n=1 Tax=Hibiscus syriacus TaxID=106335 RepID=A0A6A2ZG83_HIBSY|nr:O-Glycosyl hydrolases family 17 protein [Hibiscus syriacus]
MELAPLSHEESSSSGLPHDALFIVLAYLPLFELLSMSRVCRSLQEAVENDVLPWLNIIVEKPLNFRLSDEILMKIASKANGRLKTLTLMFCAKITDDGLQRVIDHNPHISKLHIPGCTGLTPNGVITAVQKLSDCQHSLKSLQVNGIANMKKEHLERIQYYLQTKPKLQLVQPRRQPLLYHNYRKFQAYRWEEHGRVIDVEICPKCNEVRVLFDCPRRIAKGAIRFNNQLSDVRVLRSEV